MIPRNQRNLSLARYLSSWRSAQEFPLKKTDSQHIQITASENAFAAQEILLGELIVFCWQTRVGRRMNSFPFVFPKPQSKNGFHGTRILPQELTIFVSRPRAVFSRALQHRRGAPGAVGRAGDGFFLEPPARCCPLDRWERYGDWASVDTGAVCFRC
jgi:hypothetical protein